MLTLPEFERLAKADAIDRAARFVPRRAPITTGTETEPAAKPAEQRPGGDDAPRAFRAQLGADLVLGLAVAVALGMGAALVGSNLVVDYLAAHDMWPAPSFEGGE